MADFTPREMNFCKEIIANLLKHPLCHVFTRPVDPERDQAADYFKVISNPMDLGTISTKLNSGRYQSSAEFVRDIDLVWTNAMHYNKKTVFLHQMAAVMKQKCQQLLATIPKTEHDDWLRKFQRTNKKLGVLLRGPFPEDNLIPSSPGLAIR
jgi:trimethylamine:corrinoid methyltransferase-like protein